MLTLHENSKIQKNTGLRLHDFYVFDAFSDFSDFSDCGYFAAIFKLRNFSLISSSVDFLSFDKKYLAKNDTDASKKIKNTEKSRASSTYFLLDFGLCLCAAAVRCATALVHTVL